MAREMVCFYLLPFFLILHYPSQPVHILRGQTSALIIIMIKTNKQKKKHKSTEIKSLKRDFCNGCVMLKNKPEKACKENKGKNFNKTQGFEENAIFTCFEFKLDKKNTLLQPSLSAGIFYITLSDDLRTQTSHPANWHLHIPETYKI